MLMISLITLPRSDDDVEINTRGFIADDYRHLRARLAAARQLSARRFFITRRDALSADAPARVPVCQPRRRRHAASRRYWLHGTRLKMRFAE